MISIRLFHKTSLSDLILLKKLRIRENYEEKKGAVLRMISDLRELGNRTG